MATPQSLSHHIFKDTFLTRLVTYFAIDHYILTYYDILYVSSLLDLETDFIVNVHEIGLSYVQKKNDLS